MNIESKRYHVTGAGVAMTLNIRDKKTGIVTQVRKAPASHRYLASISEAQFDYECQESIKKGEWVYA